MKKALHLFASDGHNNSGDFIIGPATKWHFENNIIKEEIQWSHKNIRDHFKPQHADFANKHDYVLIGGGGLILPDTNPNNISCWQWPVASSTIKKITAPMYIVAMGYNLFHNQKITMPYQMNAAEVPERHSVFKDNMESLIETSEYFSLRHNGDCDKLKKIVDPKYHDKIKFEFCPTIEFSKHYKEKHNLSSDERNIYAFEVKDDRPDRRYYNTSQKAFYEHLENFIRHLLAIDKRVCILSHDGSTSFKNYMDQFNLDIGFISNAFSTEEKIISNYLKIDKLFCMAGHSQMMGHALGCKVVSMISHDKQKHFLEDMGEYTEDKYVDVNHDLVYNKLIEMHG